MKRYMFIVLFFFIPQCVAMIHNENNEDQLSPRGRFKKQNSLLKDIYLSSDNMYLPNGQELEQSSKPGEEFMLLPLLFRPRTKTNQNLDLNDTFPK